jgi:hypothetical protein
MILQQSTKTVDKSLFSVGSIVRPVQGCEITYALVIPKGMALWGSPKEIVFLLWGVLPKGDFEPSFPKSTLLWGPESFGE